MNIIIFSSLAIIFLFLVLKFIDNNPTIAVVALRRKLKKEESKKQLFINHLFKKKLYSNSAYLRNVKIHINDDGKIDYIFRLTNDIRYSIETDLTTTNEIRSLLSQKNYEKSKIQLADYIVKSICSATKVDFESKKHNSELTDYYEFVSNKIEHVILGNQSQQKSILTISKNAYSKFLNAGLIASIKQKFFNSVSRDEKEEATIVGMIVSKKIKKDAQAYFYLFLGMILYLIVGIFNLYQINIWGVAFFTLMILALHTNQKILEYRIKKGYYGSNYYEAKEITQFILENAENDSFSEGKIKKLILEVEVTEEGVVYAAGEVYA